MMLLVGLRFLLLLAGVPSLIVCLLEESQVLTRGAKEATPSFCPVFM